MSILIDRNTKVMTQGITGKTGAFHTRLCRDYAYGKDCFVAGVNPNKDGANFEGIPIFAGAREAREKTGATVSVIYVPPAFAAGAIDEAVDADLDLVICITEGVPVRDMIATRNRMRGKNSFAAARRPDQRVRSPLYQRKFSVVQDFFSAGIVEPYVPQLQN